MTTGTAPWGAAKATAILVLADGKIVERGTHLELLERSGLYADLYRTQFATESVRI